MERHRRWRLCLVLTGFAGMAMTVQAGVFAAKKPGTQENWPEPGLYSYDVDSSSMESATQTARVRMTRDGTTGIETTYASGRPPVTSKPVGSVNICIRNPSPEIAAGILKIGLDCRATLERSSKDFDEYAFKCPDGSSGKFVAKRTGLRTWELSAEMRGTSSATAGAASEVRRNAERATANASPEAREKALAQLPSEAQARAMDAQQGAEMKRAAAKAEADLSAQDLSQLSPKQRAQLRAALNAMHAGAAPGAPPTVTKSVWRYTKISDTCAGAR